MVYVNQIQALWPRNEKRDFAVKINVAIWNLSLVLFGVKYRNFACCYSPLLVHDWPRVLDRLPWRERDVRVRNTGRRSVPTHNGGPDHIVVERRQVPETTVVGETTASQYTLWRQEKCHVCFVEDNLADLPSRKIDLIVLAAGPTLTLVSS